MSIKSILVYLDGRATDQAVIEVALIVARRHRAHLLGLHAVPEKADLASPEARVLEQAFRDQAMQVQRSHEWSCVAGSEEAVVAVETRSHDLLIIGQTDPDKRRRWPQTQDLLESTLLRSGHPLIAVPRQGAFPHVGERILVAWNGAREAARAVEDALAILKVAEEVTVVTVGLRSGDALSVNRLVALLERHGVNVGAQGARTFGRPVGEVLLAKARELRCDLLVMGGYGHGPIREHLFGGATYFIVEHMDLPVLLSH